MTDTKPPNPNQAFFGSAVSFAALVLGAFAMGASPIFVRFVAGEVGPFASAFWRMALAIPFLYVWRMLERKKLPLNNQPIAAKKRLYYSLLAGLAFTGDLVFWHLSILNTTVANATFFATLMPVWVIGVTWLVLRKPVAKSSFLGILVCLLGGAILVGKTASVNPQYLMGDIYGIVTAFFFGVFFLIVGMARQEGMRTAEITFLQTSTTALALLVISIVDNAYRGSPIFPQTMNGLGNLLALALVSQVGGQGLMAFSLGRLPTVFSSLVVFLEAIAAAGLGWLLLGEAVIGAQMLGGVLILMGIWIARPRAMQAERKQND